MSPSVELLTLRIFPRRGSLGQRLFLTSAWMLLPLIVVGGLGVLAFRQTGVELEEFRAETVGESSRIATVRDLLVSVDDAGELYAESGDPVLGERFIQISAQINEGFESSRL